MPKCRECRIEFDTDKEYYFHKTIYHSITCQQCFKMFNTPSALDIHLNSHSKNKPHKCQYCFSAFSQKGNLLRHVRRMHLDEYYVCECGLEFKDPNNYYDHRRIHKY